MGKKVALNILYNVGIMLCLLVLFEGITSKHYSYILGGAFIGVMLIILKVRLIKQVREASRKGRQ